MREKALNVIAVSQSPEPKLRAEGVAISEGEAKQSQTARVNAMGLSHRELNARLKELVSDGAQKIELRNVYGQRYIGTDLDKPVGIEIFGTPGNDLGAFMDGPKITVHGNAQDGCGNTMNNGEIIRSWSCRGHHWFISHGR